MIKFCTSKKDTFFKSKLQYKYILESCLISISCFLLSIMRNKSSMYCSAINYVYHEGMIFLINLITLLLTLYISRHSKMMEYLLDCWWSGLKHWHIYLLLCLFLGIWSLMYLKFGFEQDFHIRFSCFLVDLVVFLFLFVLSQYFFRIFEDFQWKNCFLFWF